MSGRDVSTGVIAAKDREVYQNFVIFEMFVISVGLGIYYQSWAVGIGASVALIVVSSIEFLRQIYAIAVASICTYVAYLMTAEQPIIEVIAICGLVWLIIFGLHYFGMRTFDDVSKSL